MKTSLYHDQKLNMGYVVHQYLFLLLFLDDLTPLPLPNQKDVPNLMIHAT
jgi:hypothetical protein